MNFTFIDSPLGRILVAGDSEGLRYISFQVGSEPRTPDSGWVQEEASLREAVKQLRAYFAGSLRRFDLPLAPIGTPFQQSVWRALQEIPYGETRTYLDLAILLGNPKATRAVGAANGRNPLPIVIPCHRVIGSNGTLTGYYGGLHLKDSLLALEGAPAVQRLRRRGEIPELPFIS